MKKSYVAELSFQFALKIVNLHSILVKRREYVLSKQLLRSGTSIGANINEALAGYSLSDFTFKMSLASKEARETKYWILLLAESKTLDVNFEPYLKEVDSLVNMLSSIVKTSMAKKAS
jgi:four helix bundle protein